MRQQAIVLIRARLGEGISMVSLNHRELLLMRDSYYNVTVGDKEVKDAIWWYPSPLPETIAVGGKLCFYNEKVDVFIDGVKE